MVSQFKAVSIFIFFILFFPFQSIHSKQLALPKSVVSENGTHKIYVKDFIDRYSEYLFSFGIKDNIITRRSILNNMIGGYLLLDKVTLSIITKIGFLNNQSHLPRVLKHGKIFIFQLTNFII